MEKSSVSHNPEVPFESSAYHISAVARGKELRLTLSPLPGAQPLRSRCPLSSALVCLDPSSWHLQMHCRPMPIYAFTRPHLPHGLPSVSWTSAVLATGILRVNGSQAVDPVSCWSMNGSGRTMYSRIPFRPPRDKS